LIVVQIKAGRPSLIMAMSARSSPHCDDLGTLNQQTTRALKDKTEKLNTAQTQLQQANSDAVQDGNLQLRQAQET
jgi:hypothetical protein